MYIPKLQHKLRPILATMCLHANRKWYVTCNFNSRIETEGTLKVTGSHVYYKHGNTELDTDCMHPWIGLDWIGLGWIGLGRMWEKLGWIGLDWIAANK